MSSSPPLRKFPLVPKSTRYLLPGDFWAIPLSDGTYGCGIVLELAPLSLPSGSRSFLGALSSWRGPSPPTPDAIAGQRCLEQGVMHILAVTQTGGAILGNRPLEADRLKPWLFADGNTVKRGFASTFSLRPLNTLPPLSWWGYDVISIYAHKHLLGIQPSST